MSRGICEENFCHFSAMQTAKYGENRPTMAKMSADGKGP
jgi:hypothetical protein